MRYLAAVGGIKAAFFAQGQTLLHPETVLLINDGESEPVELNRLLEQGVGADDNPGAAISQCGIGFPAGFDAQAAH